MSILDLVQTTITKAPRITLYGKPGIGKTSLAASFPHPLFLLTEETGLSGIDSLPVAKTFEQFWDYISQLLTLEELPFKTLVIDSVSKLDVLITEYILSKETKATTLAAACGGYGAGYAKAAQIHRGIKSKMDAFQDRGITVIYVSHMCVKTHKSPDAEDYDVFSIVACHDKVREVYIDDVDATLFCRLKSYVSETETGRSLVKSTEQRIIVTGVNEVNVSKNRYNMPAEIPMSFKDISKYIPFYQLKEEE